MQPQYDLIVVGGGVLGTFHAYHALERGLKVALIERDNTPQGATISNFGQIVPSGMNSKWQLFGRESLRVYKEIQQQFDISVRQEGSVYFASNPKEEQLLVELHQINKDNDYPSVLLTKKKCLNSYPGLRKDYVTSGLFFPEEIMVEPRVMINRLHKYLKAVGLVLFSNCTVIDCMALSNGIEVQCSNNKSLSAAKVIICNGTDFKTLYPKLFRESDLVVSKLQMMQTKSQQKYRLPSSIFTGRAIRSYGAFQECPSYTGMKSGEKFSSVGKKCGVQIIFKQSVDGSIILGESQQSVYVSKIDTLGTDLDMDVDNYIQQEAKRIIDLPTYEIQRRWYGLFSHCKSADVYQATIDDNIHIVTGIGRKGLTGSAGFAKANIHQIFNLRHV
ncbi:TIGR03364 family FAD-dependent oxidoreductase [Maribacter sp. ANRC-HE7]|uniref:TIGR03364 family FAD-dependent oxidoreductase n=1 Tax=Maribacter aquimaris TaxID=2737171 RepID=A0ABR7V6I1_9FLAO|nr:TIGR03364 family FAD-dependent oxidoreductase [Maribacter aquimaris]